MAAPMDGHNHDGLGVGLFLAFGACGLLLMVLVMSLPSFNNRINRQWDALCTQDPAALPDCERIDVQNRLRALQAQLDALKAKEK